MPVSAPRPAAVRPMTPSEFGPWRAAAVAGYARERGSAQGLSAGEALEQARRSFEAFLPQGQDTPGTWLLVVLDDEGESVGRLWIGPQRDQPAAHWLYDIEIDEHRRSEGYGRRAMLAAEQVVREAGGSRLGLNVFGANARARGLYESLGYLPTSIQMAKELR